MGTQNQRPLSSFRFLDLPTELRLMVYEYLPVTTRHHVLQDPHSNTPSTITLVAKSLSVALLAANRLISEEAKQILSKKLAFLKTEPLRFIADATSAMNYDATLPNILRYISTERAHIRQHGLATPSPAPLSAPYPTLPESNFIRKCAVYAEARSPRSTIIAVQQH
ncbi:hypothetical protein EJ02DRAFT_457082 [Clathrospora elynae]|uniref:F-box domain-containing protein n=1 Tax=Clathrospora elynae TaxID=706981 RepID=A0A6A5SFA9_9PLEO|nr:hypothetical protein EJ02DRAFT_457082 [Clathrospora elynae]